MAHAEEIQIFKIAQTGVNWDQLIAWLKVTGVPEEKIEAVVNTLGFKSVPIEGDPEGELCLKTSMGPATDASALVAAAGKRCYKSFLPDLNPNVSKVREDHLEYINNILKSGHGSVLEHATWTFAIENISRVFTGEMNRHRAGVAISEGSMRYIRYDDISYWEPELIQLTEEEERLWGRMLNHIEGLDITQHEAAGYYEFVYRASEPFLQTLGQTQVEIGYSAYQKMQTKEVFGSAFEQMEKVNINLSNIWKIGELKDFGMKKKLTSLFRRIIGMGIATGGVWTMNARALHHILHMRGSAHAEEEIYHVFNRIAEIMVRDEPALFGAFSKDEKGNWTTPYGKI